MRQLWVAPQAIHCRNKSSASSPLNKGSIVARNGTMKHIIPGSVPSSAAVHVMRPDNSGWKIKRSQEKTLCSTTEIPPIRSCLFLTSHQNHNHVGSDHTMATAFFEERDCSFCPRGL